MKYSRAGNRITADEISKDTRKPAVFININMIADFSVKDRVKLNDRMSKNNQKRIISKQYGFLRQLSNSEST